MKHLKTAAVGVAVLGLATVGITNAVASTRVTPPTAPAATAPATASATGSATESSTAADTDNVQEGDQSTPDVPGAADEATGAESATSESGVSDGADGGHEDPPGDVNHEGGAGEK